MTELKLAVDYVLKCPHDPDGKLFDEPCGCHACNEQIQHRHTQCRLPNKELLYAENIKLVYRSYQDSSWYWYLYR